MLRGELYYRDAIFSLKCPLFSLRNHVAVLIISRKLFSLTTCKLFFIIIAWKSSWTVSTRRRRKGVSDCNWLKPQGVLYCLMSGVRGSFVHSPLSGIYMKPNCVFYWYCWYMNVFLMLVFFISKNTFIFIIDLYYYDIFARSALISIDASSI